MANEKKKERVKVGARCDIHKVEDAIILRIEMPGVGKDNIDIKVDGDHLIVVGNKKIKREGNKFIVREIRDADYFQKFTIDSTINRNEIDAEMKDGVLTLTLGIRESEKTRKIPVNAG